MLLGFFNYSKSILIMSNKINKQTNKQIFKLWVSLNQI